MKKGTHPRSDMQYQYLLDHMKDPCPKWPFSRKTSGYPVMRIGGKRVHVHRVVCELVHGKPPFKGAEAAHLCGKGHEGCFGAFCLRWKTHKDNSQDAIVHKTWTRGENANSKLKEEEVKEIFLKTERSVISLAKEFKVSRGTIRHIRVGQTWSWLTQELV